MKVSQAFQTLAQVPGSYLFQVEQDGRVHEVLALEYSHDPARAVAKLAPAERIAIDLVQVDAARVITTHKVNPVNDTISLLVLDEPGAGGANHEYLAAFTDKTGLPHQTRISFQNGPIAINGVNGLTQEVLLAIVIDRLEAFQRGPFACKDNEDALGMIKGGLTCLLKRTQRRMAQGVEGTHAQHAEPAAEESAERCESGCDAPVVTHDAEGIPLCRECADDLAKEVGIYSWSTEDGDGQSGGFDTVEEALADAEEELRQREASATVIVWDSRRATASDRELFDGPSDDREPIDFTNPAWFVGLRVPENEVARKEFKFAKLAALPEPEATIAELNGETPPAPVPVEPAAEPLGDAPAPQNLAVPSVVSDTEIAAAAEALPAPAPKRTRRAKSQPAAELPPSAPETT